MEKSVLLQAALRHPSEVLQPYDSIMAAGGFDAIYAFTEHLGGLTIYVPSMRTIFGKCLEAEARNEFKGSNYAFLARKYGYTERHLRRMIGRP
ncbi:MAG: hypothetical protein FWE05_11375 [Defluviitaleaceae bacterium]|nr:hypothetical protein [Defluviitaleaceae bacterium]